MQSKYGIGNRSMGSSASQQKPAKGLWGKLRRFFQTGMLKSQYFYRKFRSLLWVGTTGFIFVIAPFAFAHFLEVSEELNQIAKMGGMSESKFFSFYILVGKM